MFAAGADIAELHERDADAALLAINAGLFDRLEAHRWPTIALVDGPALGGGCELALACDLRLVSEHAVFAQPELALGILAGAGANWRLPHLAGIGVARRMLYTGSASVPATRSPRSLSTRSPRTCPDAGASWRRQSRADHGAHSSSPSSRCAASARRQPRSTWPPRLCCLTAKTNMTG
jgi:Enoyl-CoA hydratase/isomerase